MANKQIPLNYLQAGKSFKVVDESWLKQFPSSTGVVYQIVVMKNSGGKLMVQVQSSRGCTRMNVPHSKMIMVEEVVVETKLFTLADLYRKYVIDYKTRNEARPTSVKINLNGSVGTYKIDPYTFWNQNHLNIRLVGLSQYGGKYKVPGAAIVMEEIFN